MGVKVRTDGKKEEPMEPFRIVNINADTATHAAFVPESEGGRGGHASGGYAPKMICQLTVGMSAAGALGPLVLSVHGLTERELSVKDHPNGVAVVEVMGMAGTASEPAVGYVLLIRGASNTSDETSELKPQP